jgi:hypothetical protein
MKVFVEDKGVQEVEGSLMVDGAFGEIVRGIEAISFLLAQVLPEAQSKARHSGVSAPEA